MDMRCDRVDIANVLGIFGMAVARVYRQINGQKRIYNRNEIIILIIRINATTRRVNRLAHVDFVEKRRTKPIYERPAGGLGLVG